ncbi:hypothetical protein [uncultured Winogradskyella sp.]|uniref:hypothetical protein n=1 Tax=uncultured Winogradskyella sp. TaxID=395353 RepID=UPI0025D567BA|nr:hypothetical protein [uncultured Winogradskyella sp.]
MILQRKLSVFGFVTLSFLSLYFIGTSSVFETETARLSPLITIDVILTIPLVYFLLIRKTSIPKITVIPITITGVILASYIIPEENQSLLSLFKTWVLPIVELFVLAYIIFKVRKTIRLFKENREANAQADFFTILKQTSTDILPKFIVIPFATEIAVIYYGFIHWKKRKLKTNEFSYHKNSGSIGLYMALILLIAVETVSLHALLSKSSNMVGVWILTILSTYTGIQIFGFAKSLLKRPIIIENDKLYIRYGIMKETEIEINTVACVEISSKDLEKNSEVTKMSLLGGLEAHNLIIHLKQPNTIVGLYGIKKEYQSLALSIDKKEEFKIQIEKLITKD